MSDTASFLDFLQNGPDTPAIPMRGYAPQPPPPPVPSAPGPLTGMLMNRLGAGGPPPVQPKPVAPPPVAPPPPDGPHMFLTEDRSHGLRGQDWLATQQNPDNYTPPPDEPAWRQFADTDKTPSSEHTYDFSGSGSLGDFEGRHEAARQSAAGMLDDLQLEEMKRAQRDPYGLGAYSGRADVDVAKRGAESDISQHEESQRRNAFIDAASKIDDETERKINEIQYDPRFKAETQERQIQLRQQLQANGEARKQTLLQAFGLSQNLKVNSLYDTRGGMGLR